MQFEKFSPEDGHVMSALWVDAHTLLASPKMRQLQQFLPDPRDSEKRSIIASDRQQQRIAELRGSVQRAFTGAKRANVPNYAAYIAGVTHGEDGDLPPIHVFIESPLTFQPVLPGQALGFVVIRYGELVCAVDGESQLAARFDAAAQDPALLDLPVPIKITHGKPVAWARQAFCDLNQHGVKALSSATQARDSRDVLVPIARHLAENIPLLRGRVEEAKRNLSRTDPAIMTFSTLRAFVGAVAFDIRFAHFKRDRKITLDDAAKEAVTRVALAWFSALVDAFAQPMQNRESCIVSSPSVMVALGALAHPWLALDDETRLDKQRARVRLLREINWFRGEHWIGVAGHVGTNGRLTVASIRETAARIHAAITSPTDPNFRRIRPAHTLTPN